MKVDAHQHFWDLTRIAYPWLEQAQYAMIRKSFVPEELAPLLQAAGIDKTVLVQAKDSAEDTKVMLEWAEQYKWIAGVVGWVPLDDPDEAHKQLEQYAKNPLFKGVRHLIHDEADSSWLIRDNVIEGLRVLASFQFSFDVVAQFRLHLKHVPILANKVPNLRMVIDHLANPLIREREVAEWAQAFRMAAEFPQVYAKISGLSTNAHWNLWTAENLRVYVEEALAAFGANRLMFGSDWPVSTLAGDYHRVWTETNQLLAELPEEDVRRILGGTAVEFYRL